MKGTSFGRASNEPLVCSVLRRGTIFRGEGEIPNLWLTHQTPFNRAINGANISCRDFPKMWRSGGVTKRPPRSWHFKRNVTMGALLSAILKKPWRSGGVTKRTPRSWHILIFAGFNGTNRDISNETWRSGGVILWHLSSWQFALDANYDLVPKIVTFQMKRDDLKLRSPDRDISNETWRSQAQIPRSWHFKRNVTISSSDP